MPYRLAVFVAAVILAAPAWAAELPTRKAGLWEISMEFPGRKLPAQTMKQCTDAASDKQMAFNFGGGAQQCQKQDIGNSGGTITVDSVCNFGGMISTSHAVITGDFNSAYTVEVASKREGVSPGGQRVYGDSKMTLAAKYLGACAAGQRPGDIIMGNGMTMNVLDMQKRAGGMPPR